MPRRQPEHPPRLWLMTDERLGDGLAAAIGRLPRGAGIIFRHYATAPATRRALFARVRKQARARGLVLILAGPVRDACAWGADGVHGPAALRAPRPLLRTMAAHDAREVVTGRAADLLFVSPVYPTRSHPGAPALGRARFVLLARNARPRIIALGGMTAARARGLSHIHGWAAIDAWSR